MKTLLNIDENFPLGKNRKSFIFYVVAVVVAVVVADAVVSIVT